MKSKPLKIAVVGCGYWGPNLIRVFSQLPQILVSIVCDQKQDRLTRMKSIYPFVQTTKRFQDILNSDADAVVIATPLHSHFHLADAALKAGKHVLIEKPFVNSSSQAQTLISLAKRAKKVLMIDNTFDYTEAVNYIKNLYKKNTLGSIYTVDMVRVNLGLFQNDINVVWDLAYHDISILFNIFNLLPIEAICTGQGFIQENIEDTAYILLKYPNKMLVSIHVSWLEPKKIRRMTIVGSKKMLIFDDVELSEKLQIFDRGVSVKSSKKHSMRHFENFYEFTYLYRSGDIFIPKLEMTEPLKSMAEHFIESINKKTIPRSSGEVGLQILRVLEMCERSLRHNGTVTKLSI